MNADNSKAIVVADDNPVLVSLLTEIFREAGWTVISASDGFGALSAIRSCSPQILLSDLNMPAMSGFELLSVVRCKYPGIGVVAMSGSYGGEDVPRGVAADGFYAKGSTSVKKLLELVSGLLTDSSYTHSRKPAPVWAPRLRYDVVGPGALLTTCPECLRASVHQTAGPGILQIEVCCLHCLHAYRLSIVKDCSDTDMSTLVALQRSCKLDLSTDQSNIRCLESAEHR